ncbi:MAG: arginine--tRNA ligase [Parachlamydiales bacterium]|nr:arginine--tRNA ligase [Parachlamydiales bacterium]
MIHLPSLLAKQFQNAYIQAFEKEPITYPEITHSTQPQFGHYQCNSAMKYAKDLKMSPVQLAQKWLTTLEKNLDGSLFIADVSIAGPGFINITLEKSFIENQLNQILKSGTLKTSPQKKERIIVDFSSPNVAKELHVGHLRSTIIGDSLARLFEFLGHDVLRLNHIGDWGTQFGMLIAFMKQRVPGVFDGTIKADLPQLMNWYRLSKEWFDEDPVFKSQAQQEVVALQGGNTDSLKAWNTLCDISRRGYQEIYDLLDIRIQERGESFYNPQLPGVVEELKQKGFVENSGGAQCLFVDGYKNREGNPLPLMLQKTDGGYTYDTTDMAAIKQRIQEEKVDRIVYVTDAGQSTHFQMLFKGAEKVGYLDPQKVRVDHVPFGVVLGSDGKKFKTRSGKTEKLIDLITQAIDKAEAILKERELPLNEQEMKHTAHVLGIDAIKYADLSNLRISDYVFSYQRMLKFEGNTAAFLLYAYVRVAGIKRKIGIDIEPLVQNQSVDLTHPSEMALGTHLLRFVEILETMSRDLYPNRLCDYLFDLAERFHAFFRDCRVEGSDEQMPRLLLCELVARTLKTGMDILGLKVLEKM